LRLRYRNGFPYPPLHQHFGFHVHRKAYKDTPFPYFFVGRKAESELCRTVAIIAEDALGIPFGFYEHFGDLFRAIMMIARKQQLTLVMDEFQEFYRINHSVYSGMQNHWDKYHDEEKINLESP